VKTLKDTEKPKNTCAHKACTRPKHARGVCRRHYHALDTFTLAKAQMASKRPLGAESVKIGDIEDFIAWIRANTGLL
jgi:hypothetical protein